MSLKVLLPVDRARNSKTAEEYALEFHKKAPLEVTLLSVINEAVLQDRGIAPNLMDQLLRAQKEHSAKVLAEAAAAFKAAGVVCHQLLEYGSPGRVICRVALEEEFDLVFIGEAGLADGGEFKLGSVFTYVTQNCQVPVLMVKRRRS